MTTDTERGAADADDSGQAAAAWLDEMKRISREAREMEAEHGFLSGSGQVVIRRSRLDALLDVIEVAVAAGPWPRWDGGRCVDCGRYSNVEHRDGCFGIAMRDALEALWAAVLGTETGNG